MALMTGTASPDFPSVPGSARPQPGRQGLAAREIAGTREQLATANRTITGLCDQMTDRIAATDIEHAADELTNWGLSILVAVDTALTELAQVDQLPRTHLTPEGFRHARVDAVSPLGGLQLSQLRKAVDAFDARIARTSTPPLYPTDVEALVRGELEQIMAGADFDVLQLIEIARDPRYATTLAGPFGRALALRWPTMGPAIVDAARTTLLDLGDERMTVARDIAQAAASLVEALAMASWIAVSISQSEGVDLASSL